jgi:putative SOS response-associated peptidase YedK
VLAFRRPRNPDVVPIHDKATPVLLLDKGSLEMWMQAPWDMAQSLQRPPPASALRIAKWKLTGLRGLPFPFD